MDALIPRLRCPARAKAVMRAAPRSCGLDGVWERPEGACAMAAGTARPRQATMHATVCAAGHARKQKARRFTAILQRLRAEKSRTHHTMRGVACLCWNSVGGAVSGLPVTRPELRSGTETYEKPTLGTHSAWVSGLSRFQGLTNRRAKAGQPIRRRQHRRRTIHQCRKQSSYCLERRD